MAHEIVDNLCWYHPASEIHGVPWHNIGDPVDGLTSDYLRLTPFNRNITVEPLFGADGNASGILATRDNAGRYLGAVSDRYAPLQPESLLQAVDYLVSNHGAEVSCAAIIRDGKREFISLALPDSAIDVRHNDTVKRYLNIGNGHDGKLACFFGDSSIRVVCANTLGAWLSEGTAERMRHRAGIEKALASALAAFSARTLKMTTEYRQMAERVISPQECATYFEAVSGETEERSRETRKGRPSLGSRLWSLADDVTRQRGIELSGVTGLPSTAWDALNLATQVISHETVASSPLDSMLFGTRQTMTAHATKVAHSMFLST
jgi:phage/plasmid-like protein (TIGR03299 family)